MEYTVKKTQHTALNLSHPLEQHASINPNKPVRMLNLCRFRLQATYTIPNKLPPMTGQEAYMTRYVPAFTTIANGKEPIQVTFFSANLVTIVGPPDEKEYWHTMALIEYPSLKHFEDIVGCDEYKRDAEPHRDAALEDWRLIACGVDYA